MSKLWRFTEREGGKDGEGRMELEEEKGLYNSLSLQVCVEHL